MKPYSAGTGRPKLRVGAVETAFGGTEVSEAAVCAVKRHSAGTGRPKLRVDAGKLAFGGTEVGLKSFVWN